MKPYGQTQAAKQDPLTFFKMAGGGNDFVVIDNRERRVSDAGDLTRRICTPHLSVGADGLILVESSAKATFKMIYMNADGSRADFCANGTRCAARFAFMNVIAPRKMTIETDYGVIGAEVAENGAVTLALPTPTNFQPERPLRVGNSVVSGSFLLVGVPHYVIFMKGELWMQPIEAIGKAIRHHLDLAPAGANVNFVAVRDWHSIEVRTYERGVEAETLSCGSGVVASAVTTALFGKGRSPVSVLTRSGITLEVSYAVAGDSVSDVRLKGDARLIYKAALTPETVEGFDPDFFRNPVREAVTAE